MKVSNKTRSETSRSGESAARGHAQIITSPYYVQQQEARQSELVSAEASLTDLPAVCTPDTSEVEGSEGSAEDGETRMMICRSESAGASLGPEDEQSDALLRQFIGAIRENQHQVSRLNQAAMATGLEAMLSLAPGGRLQGNRAVPPQTPPPPRRTGPLGAGGLMATIMRRRAEIREKKAREQAEDSARRSRRRVQERGPSVGIVDLLLQQQQLALDQGQAILRQHSRIVSPALDSFINSICKKVKWDSNSSDLHNEECPVCLKPFTNGCDLKVMPCGHGGCIGCLKSWFKITRAVCCPICRTKFSDTIPQNLLAHD
mmetsp:Transcript_6587/g.8940  ORF Transcript_6587/g.8940 Transcript_6587/m.8940 type:complete len:317 (+) Transcript_6587:291-1241(+)